MIPRSYQPREGVSQGSYTSAPQHSQQADGLSSGMQPLYQESHNEHWSRQQQGPAQAPASAQRSLPLQLSGRSTPIAIVRNPDDNDGEQDYETDDDDSVVDVERDAIRLRRKYGASVMAATYHQGMDASTVLSRTLLKAPYLGSLSRSENFLMDLPPMSLSDLADEPPHDVPGEVPGYGSLRDSQQRGVFLDGPSSYREPQSGRMRQLEHRPQDRTTPSSKDVPTLSIGERIQEARKKRETRQQPQEPVSQKGTNDAPISSSLSVMMDEVLRRGGRRSAEVEDPEPVPVPPPQHLIPTFAGVSERNDQYDPPTMLSTSLTAFEILSSSNEGGSKQHNDRSLLSQTHQVSSIAVAARAQGFQPLSRSLSDPTPRYLQRNPQLATGPISQTPPPMMTQVENGWAPPVVTLGLPSEPIAGDGTSILTLNNSVLQQAAYQDPGNFQNPDTDATFEMDIE